MASIRWLSFPASPHLYPLMPSINLPHLTSQTRMMFWWIYLFKLAIHKTRSSASNHHSQVISWTEILGSWITGRLFWTSSQKRRCNQNRHCTCHRRLEIRLVCLDRSKSRPKKCWANNLAPVGSLWLWAWASQCWTFTRKARRIPETSNREMAEGVRKKRVHHALHRRLQTSTAHLQLQNSTLIWMRVTKNT